MGVGIAALSIPNLGFAKAKKRRNPNIIYILADDLGYGDLSCLNVESKIPTPNIDNLASEGLTFTDAHSGSAVCSPTRYGILTGRYAWRSHLQKGVLRTWDEPLIAQNRLTVPSFLKSKGYQTACIGKWHLGWDWPTINNIPLENKRNEIGVNIDFSRSIKNGPTTRGFDYYFGTSVPNFPPYCFIENDRTVGIPTVKKPSSMFGIPGLMLEDWDLTKILPELEKKALQYINEKAKSDNPFFLYFPLTAPHTPIAPDKNYKGKSEAGAYGDFVYHVDDVVGTILKALEENGIAENTLIIFTSDNGSPGRDGTNMSGPLNSVNAFDHYPSHIYKGTKADIWEGGHRVPFIAKWPGEITPNTKSDEVICHTDLFATCAAILSENLPDNVAEDSYNILPVFKDQSYNKPIREATIHHSGNGVFSIRQGKWKLELSPGSGGWSYPKDKKAMTLGLPMVQLYDLSKDISEQENLQAQYPEVVHRLINLLEKYIEEGRSVPGEIQKNDAEIDIWKSVKHRSDKLDPKK